MSDRLQLFLSFDAYELYQGAGLLYSEVLDTEKGVMSGVLLAKGRLGTQEADRPNEEQAPFSSIGA